MKLLLPVLLLACCPFICTAQLAEQPVSWSFQLDKSGENQYSLHFTAEIAPGWYLYSQFLEDGGPIPTGIYFDQPEAFETVGQATENGNKVEGMDNIFGMMITKFKEQVVFTQQVKVRPGIREISGYIEFMTCDDEVCLPPTEIPFSFTVGQ